MYFKKNKKGCLMTNLSILNTFSEIRLTVENLILLTIYGLSKNKEKDSFGAEIIGIKTFIS